MEDTFLKITNLIKVKKYHAAETLIKKELKAKSHPYLWDSLGSIYYLKKEINKAIKHFKKALLIDSTIANTNYNLAKCYEEIYQYKKSEYYFKESIRLAPENVLILFSYATFIYECKKKPNEAIIFFQKASRICNNKNLLHEILIKIASCSASMGDYDKTILNYIKALTLSPPPNKFISCLYNLSTISLNEVKKPMINKAYNFKKYNLLDPHSISLLYFIQSSLEKKNGNIEHYFEKLNQSKKARINYIGSDINLFQDYVKNICNRNFLDSEKTLHKKRFKPIFIVGMPRSGTSLMEKIIASHKDVKAMGELNFYVSELKKFTNLLKADDYLTYLEITNKIFSDYSSFLESLNLNKIRHTNKNPYNFCHLDKILYCFPDAKIIHCIRDPISTCFSIYSNFFTNGNGYTNKQDDIVIMYKTYEKIMSFWLSKYKNKIYDIDLNTLTKNPKDEIKKLLNFCDLSWDENCLSPEKNNQYLNTISRFQVKKGIYSYEEKWRKYIDFIPKIVESFK